MHSSQRYQYDTKRTSRSRPDTNSRPTNSVRRTEQRAMHRSRFAVFHDLSQFDVVHQVGEGTYGYAN